MRTVPYAHSLPGAPPECWQHLSAHLSGVAERAAQFAADFDAAEWGRLAGQWHDLGKYSREFQDYICRAALSDAHVGECSGKVDHSSAGAQNAVAALDLPGHLLAFVIAGHHSGLLDARGEGASLLDRLAKAIPDWKCRAPDQDPVSELELPDFVRYAMGTQDNFAVAFFVRMLYSCLVDADFLDTEAFMNGDRAKARPDWPPCLLESMAAAVSRHVAGLQVHGTPIDGIRTHVRDACIAAAAEAPGLFSLTVPTGGGKTLSSLSFALEHAVRWGLGRVVYVAPFTSIIEQNADVFRSALGALEEELGRPVIVEHHSNIDDDEQSVASRLATENWDAPLVVTTTVQFYESLFANRSSRCRKLHNLCRSVIVLDEAQKLPVDLLEPTLKALKELAGNYGATIVLCTATQPAVHRRSGFGIGLEGVREIMPDPPGLYSFLKRVRTMDRGRLADAELADILRGESQVLCIVNTRRHARILHDLLEKSSGVLHLSASMCPAHRSAVLSRIRDQLDCGQACRVISTQVVEAGVDLDFPVVYRSLAGVDSLAQSAGRCNRNGRLASHGTLNVFRSEHDRSERFFAETSDVAAQILELHDDPLSLAAVEQFFRLYYWEQSGRWDSRGICRLYSLVQDRELPFDFRFASVAAKYRLIDEAGQNVFVPWGDTGRVLCERLRSIADAPPGALLRKLQRYVVQVPRRVWDAQLGKGLELVHDRYPVLVSPELNYREATGLDFENERTEFLSF